jgi:hypothetical protein
VGSQVSVSKIEHFFQRIEVHRIVDNQYGHHRQTNAIFEDFVQTLNNVFHFSYLKYMRVP